MAAKRGEHLPRLSIATSFGPATAAATMFSPLPTVIPHFHPMSTPMQPFFAGPPLPAAPQRPTHRPNQASMQLAAAGILPPPNFMTPLTSHFPRSSISLPPQQQISLPHPPHPHPFPGRGRRQLSIGGPPKAVLGGPARKLSPVPAAQAANIPSVTAAEKKKKLVVNLPKETFQDEVEQLATRPEWARQPLPNAGNDVDISDILTQVSTAEIYPPDAWRVELPDVIDVYLPGKAAWEALKQKDIEEKLEKLGVERGSGSSIPHIYAPHARAASISSPADPALLLFKLNKLQLAQQEASSTSATNSLSVSPQPPFLQPPFGLSPSPRRLTTNRLGQHGYTASLAQPPSESNSLLSDLPSHFGATSNGVVDNEFGDASTSSLSVSQDGRRAWTNFMAPPLSAVGAPAPRNQLDFIRGFGLDVPLESDEEDTDEIAQRAEPSEDEEEDGDRTQDMDLDDKSEAGTRAMAEVDDATTTTGGDSRFHSRHVSRISAALSLRSVGGNFQAQCEVEREDDAAGLQLAQDEVPDEEQEAVQPPADPTDDWTGSEDLNLGVGISDDESIGEFSNPSDEERARQERGERRMHRRATASSRQPPVETDQPRRIPDFPRPPDNSIFHGDEEEMISNPSEENLIMARRADFMGVSTETFYPESSLGGGTSVFGLSGDGHSRVASGQYSAHDPALAHSRQVSGSQRGNTYTQHDPQHRSVPGEVVKKETLNPFAKPFVFGASSSPGVTLGGESEGQSSSGSWQPFKGEATPPMPIPTVSTHSRMPSFGKPLSAKAPEFKPGQFDFRLPGAPQMPLAPPPLAFPLVPLIQHSAVDTSSPYKVQGREKRQRRDSNSSQLGGENSMTSFRFPPPLPSPGVEKIGHRHRHRSGSLDLDLMGGQSRFDPSAHPFTFAEFSSVTINMPNVPKEDDVVQTCEEGDSSVTAKVDVDLQREEDQEEVKELEVPPPSFKTKKSPIPLDFKHPSNTVPAGLFKALASSGDERTRRGVRSRLSSRELFEHMHRPSMDDTNVTSIARTASRNYLLSDPSEQESTRINEVADDDVFTSVRHHVRRRSSLPEALVDNHKTTSPSRSDDDVLGVGPQDLTSRLELHRLENIIGQLLDDKLEPLRAGLSKREPTVKAEIETMMADLISLFRAQLRDSAMQSLEDSQMDARAELDFQLIKDLIEHSHQEMLSTFQREVERIASAVGNDGSAVVNVIDGASKRTVNAVVEALSDYSARQEAVSLNMPSRERDLMVEKLINVLSPMLESLHTDPIDYEFLTRELAQAVKPHISQLIDLASDKRETASLIVDRIIPLLPTSENTSLDTDAITLKLITEIRRAIAPIDAFEIKEQVADLVVERLDSRFAVRDKAFNVDVVTSKVAESVSALVETQLGSVPSAVEEILALQKVDGEQNGIIAGTLTNIKGAIMDVPGQLDESLEQLRTAQDRILGYLERPVPTPDPDANVLVIRKVVETLESHQKSLEEQAQEMLKQNRAIAEKLDTLPVTFSGLRESLTELITSDDTSKHDLEELRKLNEDYQILLTKARSSYGQVRVEKDALNEKLATVEGDRDRLRLQIKDLEAATSAKAMETSVLQARNAELEDALAKALARLQAADVATQADQMTIADLGKTKKQDDVEKESLKTKVAALEVEVGFATREKETAARNLDALQRQHEQLISQQHNWDALNAASEKINLVYKLLENADEEDQQELRLHRERTRALEAENSALQKRLKDADVKLGHADKTANTARHTLTMAQQRSTEWEVRAKEYEGRLEMVQTKLEQAEQTHTQLEADYNMVQMQLEEHEADSRLVQDRENKVREQITALEAKCLRLQNELEKANNAAKLSASSTPFRPHNGAFHPPRPDSRTSMINDASANRRIAPSASSQNVPSKLSQQPSVWDSMHAPSTNTGPHQNGQNKWESNSIHAPSGRYSDNAPPTPKPRRQVYNQYQRGAPSPTPSVVSAAPTMGEDGWWS